MMTKRRKTAMRKVYDRVAKIYDLAYGPFLEEGRTAAFHAMDIKSGMSVLEVGIGTGITLKMYSHDINLTGIDISKKMLDQANKKAKKHNLDHVTLIAMSAESLEFPDNSFDRVFCPSVLSVVAHPEKVINEMIRVCKPGGRISIVSHFTGENVVTKTIDKVFDPLCHHLLGFSLHTDRKLVESNSHTKVLFRKNIFTLNFSTVYLLEKIA